MIPSVTQGLLVHSNSATAITDTMIGTTKAMDGPRVMIVFAKCPTSQLLIITIYLSLKKHL